MSVVSVLAACFAAAQAAVPCNDNVCPIVYAVRSQPTDLGVSRIKAIEETWARDLPKFDKLSVLGTLKGWTDPSMRQSQLEWAILISLRKLLKENPKAAWIVYLDDLTYVNTEELRKVLAKQSAAEENQACDWKVTHKSSYCTGEWGEAGDRIKLADAPSHEACHHLADLDKRCGDTVYWGPKANKCRCVVSGKKCQKKPSDKDTAISKKKCGVAKLSLSHGLKDAHHSRVHHYRSPGEHTYPAVASGWALNRQLVDEMRSFLETMNGENDGYPMNSGLSATYIDPPHEISLFHRLILGTNLTSLPDTFCLKHPSFNSEDDSKCATFVVRDEEEMRARGRGAETCPPRVEGEHEVHESDILFAVQTHKKFFNTRVKDSVETFARDTTHMRFYALDIEMEERGEHSDFIEERLVQVDNSIPNAQTGHCNKTMWSLRHAFKNFPDVKWYARLDDDTLLGVNQLVTALSRYNPEQPLYIGERFGMFVDKMFGYSYLTTGGGTVLSRKALEMILECEDDGHCACRGHDQPDDWYLSMCARQLELTIVHEPGFHQGRPEDYADKLLKVTHPLVSFHMGNMGFPGDTQKAYKKWFVQE